MHTTRVRVILASTPRYSGLEYAYELVLEYILASLVDCRPCLLTFFTVPLCFSHDRHVRSKYHHLIFVRLPPNILDIMIPPISSKL